MTYVEAIHSGQILDNANAEFDEWFGVAKIMERFFFQHWVTTVWVHKSNG